MIVLKMGLSKSWQYSGHFHKWGKAWCLPQIFVAILAFERFSILVHFADWDKRSDLDLKWSHFSAILREEHHENKVLDGTLVQAQSMRAKNVYLPRLSMSLKFA